MNFKKIYENFKYNRAKRNPKKFIDYLKNKGIKIGENCVFYSGLKTISIDITRPSLIEIGDNVAFNKNFKLITHDFATKVFLNKFNEFIPSSGRITIGNNVSFGVDCTVLKNVSIGDNCFIGAGSIVTKDIPANSVAIGAPAKVVCSIDEYFEKRKKECIEEALIYAKSIQLRFGRKPVIDDFWEEFPLFLTKKDDSKKLPIKKQLGTSYEYFLLNNKPVFNGFEDFLKHAGIE